jgi:hypothetical protein
MPRHPPFALNNLTTENKDARVHCAILNQRPTHNPKRLPPNSEEHNKPLPALPNGMKNQVMPGTGKTTAAHHRNRLFLQIPNRVLSFVAHHQPHQQTLFLHPPKRGCVLRSPAVADSKLASVSAFEHPNPTYPGCGLLTPFGVSCSLERR